MDEPQKFFNIAYANTSSSQKLDVYLPLDAEGPFPVIVHIHGGAFMMGDKQDSQVTPWLKGLQRGYAIVSINYRMSGEAIFPAAVIDCKTAIRFLRGNAERYHLDKNRLAVVGGSAGGNLAEMVTVSSRIADLTDLSLGYSRESEAVQACIAWFGPTDFLKMDEQLAAAGLGPCDHNEPESPESRYMGGQITRLEPTWVQKSNPMTYIHEDLPPMLLQHGSRDHLVPMMQSQIFADAVEDKLGGGRVIFEILEGSDHGGPAFVTPDNMNRMFDFLDQYCKI